jgi:hypothetical protein
MVVTHHGHTYRCAVPGSMYEKSEMDTASSTGHMTLDLVLFFRKSVIVMPTSPSDEQKKVS